MLSGTCVLWQRYLSIECPDDCLHRQFLVYSFIPCRPHTASLTKRHKSVFFNPWYEIIESNCALSTQQPPSAFSMYILLHSVPFLDQSNLVIINIYLPTSQYTKINEKPNHFKVIQCTIVWLIRDGATFIKLIHGQCSSANMLWLSVLLIEELCACSQMGGKVTLYYEMLFKCLNHYKTFIHLNYSGIVHNDSSTCSMVSLTIVLAPHITMYDLNYKNCHIWHEH